MPYNVTFPITASRVMGGTSLSLARREGFTPEAIDVWGITYFPGQASSDTSCAYCLVDIVGDVAASDRYRACSACIKALAEGRMPARLRPDGTFQIGRAKLCQVVSDEQIEALLRDRDRAVGRRVERVHTRTHASRPATAQVCEKCRAAIASGRIKLLPQGPSGGHDLVSSQTDPDGAGADVNDERDGSRIALPLADSLVQDLASLPHRCVACQCMLRGRRVQGVLAQDPRPVHDVDRDAGPDLASHLQDSREVCAGQGRDFVVQGQHDSSSSVGGGAAQAALVGCASEPTEEAPAPVEIDGVLSTVIADMEQMLAPLLSKLRGGLTPVIEAAAAAAAVRLRPASRVPAEGEEEARLREEWVGDALDATEPRLLLLRTARDFATDRQGWPDDAQRMALCVDRLFDAVCRERAQLQRELKDLRRAAGGAV